MLSILFIHEIFIRPPKCKLGGLYVNFMYKQLSSESGLRPFPVM